MTKKGLKSVQKIVQFCQCFVLLFFAKSSMFSLFFLPSTVNLLLPSILDSTGFTHHRMQGKNNEKLQRLHWNWIANISNSIILLIRLASLQRRVLWNDAGFHYKSVSSHKKNAQEEDKAETQEVTVRDFHDKGKTKKLKRLFRLANIHNILHSTQVLMFLFVLLLHCLLLLCKLQKNKVAAMAYATISRHYFITILTTV